MDIRKYFTSQSKPSKEKANVETANGKAKVVPAKGNAKKVTKPQLVKRPSLIIDSDSEEEIFRPKRAKASINSDEKPLQISNGSKKGNKKDADSKADRKLVKSKDQKALPEEPIKKSKKKKDILEISDDEDSMPKMKKKVRNCKLFIDDSDEESASVKKPTPKKIESKPKRAKHEEKKKLELSVSDYFGTTPVQHGLKIKMDEPSRVLKKENFFDIQNNNGAKILSPLLERVTPPKASKVESKAKEVTPKAIKVESKSMEVTPKASKVESKAKEVTPANSAKTKSRINDLTPQSNKKAEETPSSARKSTNGAAYQSYLNRPGPSALGSKVIPQGADNCFKGLNFVITGVMESLERDDMGEIIKKYGGKVTQSVSKNTSYMVVGVEAGPSKLEKADKLGIKQLTEDSFLNLIKSLSPGLNKSENQQTSSKKSLFAEKEENTSKNDALKIMTQKETSPAKRKIVKENKIIGKSSTETKKLNTGSSLMWVDKYKPANTQNIIGQQGPRSNVQKLKRWLSTWHNNYESGKFKKGSFGKWGSEDGSSFKAALLSGPPGVGKTTTAQLVCKEAGFTFIELNASDTRSKKSLESIVAEMVHNKSMTQLIDGNSKNAKNHCLLMDEVDGMAGNEDRGGIQQLIQIIKSSHIPIICMCNDRQHIKIRSLASYCFDLRFQNPSIESLKSPMLNICTREGLNISSQNLEDIIIGANRDVRQVIHNLSMWNASHNKTNTNEGTKDNKIVKKDIKLNPFEALRLVFSAESHKTMSIHDKSDLFFYNYSFAGLFVQENYLSIRPENLERVNHIDLISKAADSICDGDLVQKLIRTQENWNLLPTEAMFASVIPGNIMEGKLTQMVNFPSWLGRNSTRGKNDRILQELHLHTRLNISGNKEDLNRDYLPFLRNAVVSPIVTQLQDGIPAAISVMNDYSLRREDLDSIIEICLWPKQENPLKNLSPQVKAAFTRAYNKESKMSPYSVLSVSKKRIKETTEGTEEEEEELVNESEEEEEDISKDAMIKMKPASKRKADKKTESITAKKGQGNAKKRKTK